MTDVLRYPIHPILIMTMRTTPLFCTIGAALCLPLSAQQANAAPNPLTEKEQSLVLISSCTAKGDQVALRQALEKGLNAGWSTGEVREILVQLYAYCGFPRSLNALNTLMGLIREREAAGIKDDAGREPSPLPPAERMLEQGTENQTRLCGAPVKGLLYEFAPAIDTYLKAHLFGDIFSRDNVDWRTRELATIAALSTMKGTEGQLASHIRVGLHNGLTEQQVEAILELTRTVRHEDAFPLGELANASVFSGPAWVSQLVKQPDYDMAAYNVTFAPGVRNNWHIHSVGQILLCTVGTGYYQEKGKLARRLQPGDVVEIPADTEHWHGAAPDSIFVHIGMTPKASENQTTWGGPVTDEEYNAATAR